MSVEFEDYLGAEVFDQNGGLIGNFDCIWTDDDAQAQFLGIKLNRSPDRTSVVPIILVSPDERQSCIRILSLDKDIAEAPSLDCDEQLDKGLEEKIYTHFQLSPPTGRYGLHIHRRHSD